MTETQIDIAEIKQTLKNIQEDVDLLKRQQRKEDVYFNTWLDQYNNKGETHESTLRLSLYRLSSEIKTR